MSTLGSTAVPSKQPNAQAGPSSAPLKRKPSAPHPRTAAHNASAKRRKVPPPLPRSASLMQNATSDSVHGQGAGVGAGARPGGSKTLPLKTLQGVGTKRTGIGRKAAGLGREVVLVTRKMGVGAYLGRCKSLICDEGYTHIILHAIGAAIPQSLVILHALLEVLPYPRHPRGVWYELFTGSVACTDEQEESVAPAAAGAGEASTIDGQGGDRVKSWLKDIGSVEAADTILKERIASSLQIHIHIGPKAEIALQSAPKAAKLPSTLAPKPGADATTATDTATQRQAKKRNRPGKQKRRALALQRGNEQEQGGADVGGSEKEAGAARQGNEVEMDADMDEEAALNGGVSEEEDEEVEMVE